MHSELLLTFPPGLRRELQTWDSIQPIAADGSNRRFYRLRGPRGSSICLYHPEPPGEPVTENDSFDAIGRHLRRQGLPVPEIYEYCRGEGWFLVEDLGNVSLQEHYRLQADLKARLRLYEQVLDVLVDLQTAGTEGFEPGWCFDTPAYDAPLVWQRECLYFLQAFVNDYLGLPTGVDEVGEDFAWLIRQALEPVQEFFLHRDFQSRNLMIHQGRVWLLDFQGARLGPLLYDLAALLLDPYVQLPEALQEALLTKYLNLLQTRLPLEPPVWRRRYTYVALCRNLQILGAYGFLSRQRGKTFFEQFIPSACGSLQHRLATLPETELPHLRRLAAQAATLVGGRPV